MPPFIVSSLPSLPSRSYPAANASCRRQTPSSSTRCCSLTPASNHGSTPRQAASATSASCSSMLCCSVAPCPCRRLPLVRCQPLLIVQLHLCLVQLRLPGHRKIAHLATKSRTWPQSSASVPSPPSRSEAGRTNPGQRAPGHELMAPELLLLVSESIQQPALMDEGGWAHRFLAEPDGSRLHYHRARRSETVDLVEWKGRHDIIFFSVSAQKPCADCRGLGARRLKDTFHGTFFQC